MALKLATLADMDRIVAVLEEGDGLTTQEIYEALGGSITMSRIPALISHLVRAGDVLVCSNDEWGQVIEMRDGRDDVWPGAGHLYFLDAMATGLWAMQTARAPAKQGVG